MKIIRLFLQNSGKILFIATISSFISGTSSAGVIAVINYAIANLSNLPSWLPGTGGLIMYQSFGSSFKKLIV